jgi:hypothetical protein
VTVLGIMIELAMNGCAALADEWLPGPSELDTAAQFMKEYLVQQESDVKLNGNGDRWVANFDLASLSTPLSTVVRHLLSPALVVGIATYMQCTPSDLLLDSVAAVQFRGDQCPQQYHADHGLGARVSLVLVISLTSAFVTTRFSLGSHRLPAPNGPVSRAVTSRCTSIDTRMVIFDGAVHHYGVGGGGDPGRWYGRDRLFLTLSRPLPPDKRCLYAQETSTSAPRALASILSS